MHYRQGVRRIMPALLVASLGAHAEAPVPASAVAETGMWTDFEQRRERYEGPSGEATVTTSTLVFTPYWQRGDWRAEAVIPLTRRTEEVRGTVRIQPSLLGLVQSEPRTVTESDTVHGLEDILLRLTRSHWFDDAWHTWLTGEYKADNGDAEDGLGSDSEDLSLRPGLGWVAPRGYALMEAGYTWSDEGVLTRRDRASAYAAAGVYPVEPLLIGVGYTWEDKLRASGEPLREWQYLVRWSVTDQLGLFAARYERDAEVEADQDWSFGISMTF